MRILYPFLFLCVFILKNELNAQQTKHYVNNWYFGDAAGISFTSGSPNIIPSNILAYEASTSYSDGLGNVLFYAGAHGSHTFGVDQVVWDASHTPMPNSDLLIYYSSSCGLTAVPVPGSCDRYYIFHLGSNSGGPNGLNYSVVDMSLIGNGTAAVPLGDIDPIDKNINLFNTDTLSEKLKIVQKGNTEDFWVIVRSLNRDDFYSFEVSSAGINTNPVISTISSTTWPTVTGSPAFSWIAVNKNRDLIAEASGFGPDVKLYDFDNQTGLLTLGEVVFPTGTFGSDIPYGIEFSPSGDVLYVSTYLNGTNTYILSYDITAGMGSIAATRQDYLIGSATTGEYGGMVKAYDGKIYSGRFGFTDLITIDNPEDYLNPMITIGGFDPAPGECEIGLPNISYYYHPDNFVDTLAGNDRDICPNEQVEIGALGYDSIWANYSWEPASMLEGNPNEATPLSVLLANDQEFIVYVVSNCGDTINSDTIMVMVDTSLNANLNTNSPICENGSLSLNASPTGLGAGSYSWVGPMGTFGGAGLSNVNILPFPNPIPGGWYYVTINDGTCSETDSAFVISNPTYDISDTILICSGDDFNYADGTISTNILVDESHVSLLTSSLGCDSTITEYLTITNFPSPALSNDTAYCENEFFTDMSAAGSGGVISWYSDNSLSVLLGNGNSFFPINSIGTTTYYVNETNGNCTSEYDSIIINIFSIPIVDLGIDTSFCAGDSILLNAGNTGSSYNWIPGGSITQTIYASDAGNYIVNVTDANGCLSSDSVVVSMINLPIHNGITGDDVCVGSTGILISSGIGDLSWGNGNTNDTINVSLITDTWYYSTYSNSCGTVMDSILVQVNALPQIIAMGDTTVVPLDNAFLSVTGGVDYTWSPSSGLDCSSCEDPVANVSETTTFYVVGTDTNGCVGIDSVLVIIEAGLDIFIPNVFSPNGDGENDQLLVRGSSFKDFKFSIYNRWGEMIFYTTNRASGWDGTHNGKPLDPGVFVYQLIYSDWQDLEGEKSGNVTLIR